MYVCVCARACVRCASVGVCDRACVWVINDEAFVIRRNDVQTAVEGQTKPDKQRSRASHDTQTPNLLSSAPVPYALRHVYIDIKSGRAVCEELGHVCNGGINVVQMLSRMRLRRAREGL